MWKTTSRLKNSSIMAENLLPVSNESDCNQHFKLITVVRQTSWWFSTD